jgi:hypothetical protein
MARPERQNHDPLKAKGSATRKSQTSHSALTYWSGMIHVCANINGNNAKGCATRQGGHEQFNITTTPGQLAAAGFSPFNVLGIVPNGYHNNSLFMQVHVNGQNGSQLDGATTGVLNVQAHIDVFNPAAGHGVGLVLHGFWDLGVGSIFFRHSSRLDPACVK